MSGADDQEREEESGGTTTMEEKAHSNRGSNHHLCHLWWSLSKSMVLSDSSATGVSKIPVNTRRGEERATHIINRNGEKERPERSLSSGAHRHYPPLVNDEGIEGCELRE